jgi:hypothetical protein
MKSLEEIVAGAAETPEGADAPETGDALAETVPEGEGDGPEAGAPDPEAAPAGDGPGRTVPVGALIDERRKRRAAEERLARQGAPPAGPRFRDDPEGYLRALEGTVAARIAALRVDASEAAARGRHPDFDLKARAFARLAVARPELVGAMEAAPDPAEFAYRVGAQTLGDTEGGAEARSPAFPRSLSESPSAGSEPAAVWRPKSLSEIVGGK